jgi:hypothetical protein
LEDAAASVWAIIAFGASALALLVLVFRTLTAKTGKAMAINFVLAQVVGLVALVLLSISGLGPSPEEWRHAHSQAPKPAEMLKGLPWEVLVAGAILASGGKLYPPSPETQSRCVLDASA